MAQQQYQDFLGDSAGGSTNPFKKLLNTVGDAAKQVDPNDMPNPRNPGGVSNNQLARDIAANRQRQLENRNGTGSGALAREANIRSGRIAGAAPSNYGLSLDPSTATEASKDQEAAYRANQARNGGIGGDLARLGVAGARTVYGTGFDAAAEAVGLPEPVRALTGQDYLVRAALDEGADQVIPGGSGVRGSNIVPGVEGTGGDQFYPSETIQSGSYNDGYRGVGNAPVTSNQGGGSGSGGTGDGTGGSPNVPVRPDAYRTDNVDNDLRAFLAAQKQEGPSAAEALMTKATDRIAAESLGIAASARGGAAARERATRGAQSANVARSAEASSNIAALRAQEEDARRNRQQAILSLISGNAAAGDARDLGYYESDNNRGASHDNVMANIIAENNRWQASQAPGFLDDPLAAGFEALTGRPLRTRRI